MYSIVLRVDKGDGIDRVEVPGRSENLIGIVRMAGMRIPDDAEFYHPNAGVLIEDANGPVISFQVKNESGAGAPRWTVSSNRSGLASGMLLQVLLNATRRSA